MQVALVLGSIASLFFCSPKDNTNESPIDTLASQTQVKTTSLPNLFLEQQRPVIWVKQDDRAKILAKIRDFEWAENFFSEFVNRAQVDVDAYLENPKAYLSRLPLDWVNTKSGENPSFLPIKAFTNRTQKAHNAVKSLVQIAVDCGVLYFLTEDEKYADYASAVLNSYIHGLLPLATSEDITNGGWLYPNDHLREAREIGAQIPLIYDFVFPYLVKKGLVYDLGSDSLEPFPFLKAEAVFRTYANLAINHGIINCNWPVFEASSLVGNALALSDEKEKAELLKHFLEESSAHQDALPKMVAEYTDHQGDWPESLNYSTGSTVYITYLMTLLTKYDPRLQLGKRYQEPLFALPTPYYLTYPNQSETILFGDGHRQYRSTFEAFEMAYYLGQLDEQDTLIRTFGPLLNTAVANDELDRGHLGTRSLAARAYTEPTRLLWFSGEISGDTKKYELPTTFVLPFAGLTIQRNFSTSQDPKDALMGFVGGGHFVHGHASGMNMELYGKGYVLGVKAGKSSYKSDIHENYYRLFASHNTVVVNGASQGEGGWANLKINQVELQAIEPSPWASPVSADHSFSVSSFIDDKGEGAEAIQERTLAIVRTSEHSGYYIDVFRSKSETENQFHDYIYHNVGEQLIFSSPVVLAEDPLRFKSAANKEWVNNSKARHPGWHFFEEVHSSKEYEDNVELYFDAKEIGDTPVQMNLFIPGNKNREYSKAMGPAANESRPPYDSGKNPTLIVRQKGEAWSVPFAVVYEPTEMSEKEGSIQSVESILQKGEFKGLKIKSLVAGVSKTQYALLLDSGKSFFEDEQLRLSFQGRYAVVTFDEDILHSIYVGEGSSISVDGLTTSSVSGKNIPWYVIFEGGKPKIQSEYDVSIDR